MGGWVVIVGVGVGVCCLCAIVVRAQSLTHLDKMKIKKNSAGGSSAEWGLLTKAKFQDRLRVAPVVAISKSVLGS